MSSAFTEEVSLRIGNDIFFIEFSHEYSPFLKFVEWITQITLGEVTAPVDVNDECDEHFFCVTAINNTDNLLFEYTRYEFSGVGVYRKAIVKKTTFIREWYFTLKGIMDIDFEGESKKEGGTYVWFDFDLYADKIITTFNLAPIKTYLASVPEE
jgi:hypothetical protein